MRNQTNDSRALDFAEGYCDLKLYAEAEAELATIAPSSDLDYLEMRFRLYSAKKQWDLALSLSRQIIEQCPQEPKGYVFEAIILDHAQAPQIAYAKLLEALPLFPADPLVKYNLACFACALGLRYRARKWLVKAFIETIGTEDEDLYQRVALEDVQLKPLWPELSRLNEMAWRLAKARSAYSIFID